MHGIICGLTPKRPRTCAIARDIDQTTTMIISHDDMRSLVVSRWVPLGRYVGRWDQSRPRARLLATVSFLDHDHLTGLLLGSSISRYSMMICPANFSAVASRSLSASLYSPLRSE